MENMKITTVVTGILFPLIFNNVQCMLVAKPKDAAAKIGDNVIMRCSSSYVNDTCGKIAWRHYRMNSETGDYIPVNSGDELSSPVTSYISLINSRAGNCDLRINATESAAGRYQCLHTPNEANAQLIVLNPEIEIIKTSRSNNTTLRCSVHYHGNWAPKVKWMKNGLESVASNDSKTSKSPVSSLIQIPSATFDPTGAREYFICIATISQSGGSNMPIYTWQSLKNDATWEEKTEVESTTEDANQVCGGGCNIGIYIVLVISICGCIGLTIGLYTAYKKWLEKSIDKEPKPTLAEQAAN